jgi:lysophospholipase L1-like esterase
MASRCAVLLLWLASLSAAAADQPLRILCIGDSITQGGRQGRPEYTYRLPLQRMLRALGKDVDFIGTRDAGVDNVQWPADFDPQHEGYYGATTQEIVRQAQPHLARLNPDVVLIHAGTNDLHRWNTNKAVGAPLASLIESLRARNPRVAIYIADPHPDGWRGFLLSRAVSSVVESLHTDESPVILVSAPIGWGVADTFDGAHPNERGQARWAARWLEAMARSW